MTGNAGMLPEHITALIESYNLKDELRTGWELRNITDPESVAAHSWGVAFLTLLYGENEGINVDEAVRMAVVHDVAEAWIGDHPTRAEDAEQENLPEAEKHAEEKRAVKQFVDSTDHSTVLTQWQAYEDRDSAEAVFVKDMDLIDMCLQALVYEQQGRYDPTEDNPAFQTYDNLDEFFTNTESRIQTDTGKELFTTINARYEEVKM